MNTGGQLAGVTPSVLPTVDDTSFAAAKGRVETAMGFVNSLTREQVDGAESKLIVRTAGSNDRKCTVTTIYSSSPRRIFLLCNVRRTTSRIIAECASDGGTSSAQSTGPRMTERLTL